MAATLNLEVASLSVASFPLAALVEVASFPLAALEVASFPLAALEVASFPLAALEVAMASLESGSRKLRSSGIRKSEELSGDPDIGIEKHQLI